MAVDASLSWCGVLPEINDIFSTALCLISHHVPCVVDVMEIDQRVLIAPPEWSVLGGGHACERSRQPHRRGLG